MSLLSASAAADAWMPEIASLKDSPSVSLAAPFMAWPRSLLVCRRVGVVSPAYRLVYGRSLPTVTGQAGERGADSGLPRAGCVGYYCEHGHSRPPCNPLSLDGRGLG